MLFFLICRFLKDLLDVEPSRIEVPRPWLQSFGVAAVALVALLIALLVGAGAASKNLVREFFGPSDRDPCSRRLINIDKLSSIGKKVNTSE